MSGSQFGVAVPALVGNETILLNGGGRGAATTQEIANLGTNAPSAPTITGGTINGAVIGGSAPAAGTFTTLSATTSFTFSPSGAGAISPTGALTINPTAASTINHASIGVTTPLAGKFTTATVTSLTVTSNISFTDTKCGFYGTAAVAQQTGVAVSAAGIHTALVNLGLITA